MSGSRLVRFPSGGVELAAFLYEHPGSPRPSVVMTHGFSATIRGMVADRYAEVLHEAGFNVLLVEHATFGLSGGEPRQRLNRWVQLREYHDGLRYLSELESADQTRLAVWGDSMSAASALAVAAWDPLAAAVVVQVPACGSEIPSAIPDPAAADALRDLYRAGGPGPDVGVDVSPPVPVVSADQLGNPSLLEPISAFRWFVDYGGRPDTGWLNWAQLETPKLDRGFSLELAVSSIACPSLWVVAEDDEMPGAEPAVALAMHERAGGNKELLLVDGGHFGLLYHPSARFDLVSAAQAAFLRGVLA